MQWASTSVGRMAVGASTQLAPSTALPAATMEILQSLTRSKVFAASVAAVRPDFHDEDSTEGRYALSKRSTLMRIVLSGWLTALADEEGPNGCLASTSVTETLVTLTDSIDGWLGYIKCKPAVLLWIDKAAPPSVGNGDTTLDSNLEGVQLGKSDNLASFLLPRLLRAASSLEGVLLSTDRSSTDTTSDGNNLWDRRVELRAKLEELLYEVVRTLAISGGRLAWRSKEPGNGQNGLGKAREMVREMTKLLKNLGSSNPSPTTFPQTFTLGDSTIRKSAIDDLSVPESDMLITVKSPLHARALLLTSFRTLRNIVQVPFLHDFGPSLLNVFIETWPPSEPIADHKGKQTVTFQEERILAATLALAEDLLGKPSPTFDVQVAALIVDRVSSLLRRRLANAIDQMELDGAENELDERIDASLARIMATVWKSLRDVKAADESKAVLSHVMSMAVMLGGEQMVDCITGDDSSPALQLCSVFALASHIMPRPAPSGFDISVNPSSALALELLNDQSLGQISSFAPARPRTPCDIPPLLTTLSTACEQAWRILVTELEAQSSDTALTSTQAVVTRKRRRDELSQHPSSDIADPHEAGATQKRRRAPHMESVRLVLRMRTGGGELNLEAEGLEETVARLAQSLIHSDAEQATNVLHVLGLLGCARDGSLVFMVDSEDPAAASEPACSHCDHWATTTESTLSKETPLAPRIFTETPFKALRRASDSVLDNARSDKVRLAYLKTLVRLLRHSRVSAQQLSLSDGGAFFDRIWKEFGAQSRPLRLAAGNAIVAFVRAQEDQEELTTSVDALMIKLDIFLDHKLPSVIESAMITLGRLAHAAPPQSLLECRCLERFVTHFGHPNIFLKSLARNQLEELAKYRDVKPYALVQPHFASIAPLLIRARHHSAILTTAVDCFHQSRELLLSVTAEYTLPELIVNGETKVIQKIADAADKSVPELLTGQNAASAILSYLFMHADDALRHRGLAFFVNAIKSAPKTVAIKEVLESVKVPTIYKIVLALGDEDIQVQARAEEGLKECWRRLSSLQKGDKVDLAHVLKDSIVGILSLMNRGLNEPIARRALRDKQQILRSLEAVTTRVGTGMAGFSPQIMATLQTALEVDGLRGVSLHAFKVYIETFKFSEIGPFLGTMSATFVKLWPQLSTAERTTATETLEYVVIHHADDLADYGHDIADLGGIPELATANARLVDSRRSWTFARRSERLLLRAGSENDVVVLQALKELKELFHGHATKLQTLSFGDSFDRSLGKIVKTLLAVAARDGVENASVRNVAFECIGMLGALDPDRFELPPSDPPFIVAENYQNHNESVEFALHLIQDLLIGAYRTTNDTKHQESLAFTIQELLRFCGFSVELVNPSKSSKPVDSATALRWARLPKSVLETCGPLLGSSFAFTHQVPMDLAYPIYSSTGSFREWIRSWANDLISKLTDDAKRIFGAFPPVLALDDVVVAQHLLPHLVLNALISGDDEGRQMVKNEIESVLTDQVSPTQRQSENSRLLAAQTVFDLMDHLSRWITKARKTKTDIADKLKKSRSKSSPTPTPYWDNALLRVELALSTVPHILVGEAALKCKAYARSLLNFESHIVAQQRANEDDAKLQNYYENLHECYADLDEPDGMEGISTRIVAPSILHQIREHESTGRWTSAQSCWEVRLQQAPDKPENHVGLLRCLRNLGHYDSMRTHIVGILHSRDGQAEWDRILAPFNIEASLIVGDWDAVVETLAIPGVEGPEIAFGRVIEAMRFGESEALTQACYTGREDLGAPIIAAGRESYRRVYDSVVHLHILQEIQQIYDVCLKTPDRLSTLLLELRTRLDSTSPSFRAREPILNMRRTALRLAPTEAASREIAELWLETSKIARKAGHSQTAYSAILQARDRCDPKDPSAPLVFLQDAKLLMTSDEPYKAIQMIDNALQSRIPAAPGKAESHKKTGGTYRPPTVLAKASLRRARWMHAAGRLESEAVVKKYIEAASLAPDWESPYYYLGHYHDHLAEPASKKSEGRSAKRDPVRKLLEFQRKIQTVIQFSRALVLGNKFIYQTMPRMITIWLECGEEPELIGLYKNRKKDKTYSGSSQERQSLDAFRTVNERMSKNIKDLAPYQWLTVLPQLVSRVLHPNDELIQNLDSILIKAFQAYPQQAFWAMASGARSQTTRRAKRCLRIITKADVKGAGASSSFAAKGLNLVDHLLDLCNYSISKTDPLSLRATFPALNSALPLQLIIPLQSSLTVSLPADAAHMATHKAFPDQLPSFHKFDDAVIIMTSLQRPRKISVWGTDGVLYSFLCKPKDDLRKDARLMEFNSMIIKLLKKDSDARNRRLNIRTYSVVPLNEECGLIEWVPHVVVLRSVLNKLYARHNVAPWSPTLKSIFDTIRDNPATIGERFEKEVLPKFQPVFHEWFLETFPEPSAWLRARLSYSRTAAVISMVGFVLGLGDRHCENILLDATTGDTVHVDFNCLFDRGRTFDVAEQVPFRLTTNIVAGMGVTGVEGVFRRAAEISLRILRHNKDSLMSVLETFLHDPLVEWNTKRMANSSAAEAQELIQKKAKESLDPISAKLRGLQVTSDPATTGDREVEVGEQVERLIRDARSSRNLGSIVILLILILTRHRTPASHALPAFHLPATLHSSFESLRSSFSSSKTQSYGPEWDCNPFEARGRLLVDKKVPQNNKWVPYDRTCSASTYLNELYRAEGDQSSLIPPKKAHGHLKTGRLFLPWLMNRTVVIHGDSIDRFHLKDFCTFVRGDLFVVGPDHPASPPAYVQPHIPVLGPDGKETAESMEALADRRAKEKAWDARPVEGVDLTNPWVCDIKEYGATLVSVFTWGLRGAEVHFQSERWYNAPATWTERLDHITTPLLEGLAKHLDRPQIVRPDLVELNSGFWDLRRFTEEDFIAAGFKYRPYPEESPIPYTPLSSAREQDWEREARKAVKKAARSFLGTAGDVRTGPTLLWRTLHHPHRHNYAPYPRVFGLDSLALKVMDDLRRESSPHHRDAALVTQEAFDGEGSPAEDLGLDERLRIDYSGHLMLGQELHFRDLLHPEALPGSWLWGNVMLYELKRAALRLGRTGSD